MLDLELLAYRLLTRSLGDACKVQPAHEVGDTIDHLPLVLFQVTGGNAVDGSPSPPFAWDTNLELNIYADGLDAAKALTVIVYDAVWSWDDPFAELGIDYTLGHVTAISDQAIPTRVASVDYDGHNLTQYNGVWSMQMHEIRS